MWQLQRERNTVAEGIWPDFLREALLDMYQAGVNIYLSDAGSGGYLSAT